jgi:hypothetical protein
VFDFFSETIFMKPQSKKHNEKTIALIFVLIIFGFTSAIAQIDTSQNQIHQNQMPPAKPNPQTNPNPDPNQQPTKINPNPNQTFPTTPQKIPMDTPKNVQKHYPPDNGNSNPSPGHHALTETQLKMIVGNDAKVGVDANGNQLYRESGGRTYWVNDEGTKLYVK